MRSCRALAWRTGRWLEQNRQQSRSQSSGAVALFGGQDGGGGGGGSKCFPFVYLLSLLMNQGFIDESLVFKEWAMILWHSHDRAFFMPRNGNISEVFAF
jgi:hypothetical protein